MTLAGRFRLQRSPLVALGTAVMVLVALALGWYGAMTVALALKASPHTVDSLTGYGAAYDFLSKLRASDIDSHVRSIAGPGGLLALLAFGFLAYKEIPRARVVRAGMRVSEEPLGAIDVAPKVVELVAATAAAEEPGVGSSRARLADSELELEVALSDLPEDAARSLRGARRRALAAMTEHGLPVRVAHVTLTGYRRSSERELQ